MFTPTCLDIWFWLPCICLFAISAVCCPILRVWISCFGCCVFFLFAVSAVCCSILRAWISGFGCCVLFSLQHRPFAVQSHVLGLPVLVSVRAFCLQYRPFVVQSYVLLFCLNASVLCAILICWSLTVPKLFTLPKQNIKKTRVLVERIM